MDLTSSPLGRVELFHSAISLIVSVASFHFPETKLNLGVFLLNYIENETKTFRPYQMSSIFHFIHYVFIVCNLREFEW